MRPSSVLALIAVVAALAAACSCVSPSAPGGGRILLMSYNVLALFDGQDGGDEYPDYSIARGNWSEAAYRKRLANLARVIREGGPALPDIVALQEVEGPGVARDLASLLQREGYQAFGAGGGESATRCAILSRLPLALLRSHLPGKLSPTQARGTRSILEALVYAEKGRELCIFVNHWKSRREGEAETEAERVASAALLADLMRQRRRESPGALCIACGDFNEEADTPILGQSSLTRAFCRPGSAAPSSPILILSPREWEGMADAAEDPLPLLSPWIDVLDPSIWSYAWRDERERIDMILIEPRSFAAAVAGYSGFGPSGAAFLMDADGLPQAWDTRRGSGFSDHLPLFIEISLGG